MSADKRERLAKLCRSASNIFDTREALGLLTTLCKEQETVIEDLQARVKTLENQYNNEH